MPLGEGLIVGQLYVLVSKRGKRVGKFKKGWYGPYKIQYFMPNNSINYLSFWVSLNLLLC
jgi:hypothetical protein